MSNLGNGYFIMLVCIDLIKAFNMVEHKIVLNKFFVEFCCIRDVSGDFLRSYQSDQNIVPLNNITSNE